MCFIENVYLNTNPMAILLLSLFTSVRPQVLNTQQNKAIKVMFVQYFQFCYGNTTHASLLRIQVAFLGVAMTYNTTATKNSKKKCLFTHLMYMFNTKKNPKIINKIKVMRAKEK